MSLSKFQNENTDMNQIVFPFADKSTSPIATRGFESILSKLENKASETHKTFLSNNFTGKKNSNNSISNANCSAVYSPFVIKKTAANDISDLNNSFFKNNNFELFQQRKLSSNLSINNASNSNINNNNLTNIIFNDVSDDEANEENEETAIDRALGGKHFSLFEITSSEHKKPAFTNLFGDCNNSLNNSATQGIRSFFSPEINLNKSSKGQNQTAQQQTKFYTPSPNNFVKDRRLSDRFIPLNKGTDLIEKFELTKKSQAEPESKKANLAFLDISMENLSLRDSTNRNLNDNDNRNNNNTNSNNPNGVSRQMINNSGANNNNNAISNTNQSFFANTANENLQSKFYSSLLQSNIFSFKAIRENANPSSNGGPIINRNLLSQSRQNDSNIFNNNNPNLNRNTDGTQGSGRNGTNPHLNALRPNRNNNNNIINNNNITEGENTHLSFANENNYSRVKSNLFEFKTEKTKKNKSVFVCENNLFNSLNPNRNLNSAGLNANYSFETKFGGGNENCNPNRRIPNKPFRVLDAPGLSDDFYLNLLDWSSQNTIAIGLENQVFLWCCKKTKAYKLFSYNDSPGESRSKLVTSLIWNPDGTELAVGNNFGQTEVWDVNRKEVIRTFTGHTARVGVITWHKNIISTGSKDASILTQDIRSKTVLQRHLFHKQEVCGLKWSFDGTHLASGGNDNKLCVWSLNSAQPLLKSSAHSAAVKAIAWSPFNHNLLASGGGTADKCIRFWNMNNYQNTYCLDTGSQVCNLVFSKNSNELISTHGYSLNQINLWKLPQMGKIATLTGHSFRVLYLGISPDGQSIVTGAGDETLRFWNVFPQGKLDREQSELLLSNFEIR